jgi:hypothetical protein
MGVASQAMQPGKPRFGQAESHQRLTVRTADTKASFEQAKKAQSNYNYIEYGNYIYYGGG